MFNIEPHSAEKRALNGIGNIKYTSPIDGKPESIALAEYFLRQESRKRRIRDALIYKFYLESDNKVEVIGELCEKWGIEKQSRIKEIIANQKKFGVRIAEMASNIEAIRGMRQAQLIDSSDDYLAFLRECLENLHILKLGGKIMIDISEEEESVKGEIKIKRIPIEDAIKNCHDQIMKLGKIESEALKNYDGVPANIRYQKSNHLHIHGKEASKEFIEEFNRMRGDNIVTQEVMEN